MPAHELFKVFAMTGGGIFTDEVKDFFSTPIQPMSISVSYDAELLIVGYVNDDSIEKYQIVTVTGFTTGIIPDLEKTLSSMVETLFEKHKTIKAIICQDVCVKGEALIVNFLVELN